LRRLCKPIVSVLIEKAVELIEATETAYERNDKFVREAGLDVKYGLTNNLTLDVTGHPE